MTDTADADTLSDVTRSFGATLNRIVYFLLGIIYQIFFNVSSAQLFESETIKNFYGRVQLIIGVFMVFKLAISILQGIMDPEKFTNPKDGFGSVITRVIISLALLTVLVPINVPDAANANSFEKYINNNGLLFGTLYSLQDRILSNNTLGRLILGTTDSATTVSDSEAQDGLTEADKQNEKLEKSSRIFTSTILKSFLRINLLPSEARKDDDETKQENWYCGDDLSDDAEKAINVYKQLDVDPSTLLSSSLVTMDCDIGDSWGEITGNFLSNLPGVFGDFFGIFVGTEGYVFAFEWFGSLIIGIIFLFILIGFTVDIAVRSIKLAILRLLAPIPVISYIDPKSSQDGGIFSSWVKALTSTYLDLFLRLAIIYFVVFLIQDMIANGVVINQATGMVGIMSFIFIMLGLLVFARMAPKFIKDVLGVKGGGNNIGLSGMLGGAAALVGGGGLAGAGAAMVSNMNTASQAAAEGKQAPPAWQTGSDLAAQIKTGDPKAKGGVINNLNDRLMRSAGINRARKLYGVTSRGLDMAKQAMFDHERNLGEEQDRYDRFVKGQMDQNEVDNLVQQYGSKENARQALMRNVQDAKKRYGMAKTHYEDAKQFADSHRITPNFAEEHHRSLRERVGGNRRDDLQSRNNRYSAHQRISDRIAGSYESWDQPHHVNGNERTNNRWDPSVYSNTDLNDIHGDSNNDTDTPNTG